MCFLNPVVCFKGFLITVYMHGVFTLDARYHEIFFMVDTCQAGSLSNAIVSPNVVTIGSSQTGESSYAHHSDEEVSDPHTMCTDVEFVSLTILTCSVAVVVGRGGHRSLHLFDAGLSAAHESRRLGAQLVLAGAVQLL